MSLRSIASLSLAASILVPAQASAAHGQEIWRLLGTSDGIVIMATERDERDFRAVDFETYTLLASPLEDGANGIKARFRVDCISGRIANLGSTAYSGATALHRIDMPSVVQASAARPHGFYDNIRSYACYTRRNMFPSYPYADLAGVVQHAKWARLRRM
jgi:hypothetical protein